MEQAPISVIDRTLEIVKAHPGIFAQWGKGSLRSLDIGDGWLSLFKECCEKLEACNKVNSCIQLAQVKEKFGGIRIYLDYVECHTPEQEQAYKDAHIAIEAAEAAAYKTCERCGSSVDVNTEPTPKPHGWITTMCKACRAPKTE